jgi:hypothetical protein
MVADTESGLPAERAMAPARARVSDDNVVLHANPKRERYYATDVPACARDDRDFTLQR